MLIWAGSWSNRLMKSEAAQDEVTSWIYMHIYIYMRIVVMPSGFSVNFTEQTRLVLLNARLPNTEVSSVDTSHVYFNIGLYRTKRSRMLKLTLIHCLLCSFTWWNMCPLVQICLCKLVYRKNFITQVFPMVTDDIGTSKKHWNAYGRVMILPINIWLSEIQKPGPVNIKLEQRCEWFNFILLFLNTIKEQCRQFVKFGNFIRLLTDY